jgi:putative addiction module component (TIGR02574 family)
MTRAAFQRELSRMSQAEKLQLVQELWDDIAKAPENIRLDAAERRVLDERVEAHRSNPRAAQPWSVVKRRVVAKLKAARRQK